jgi:RNA polymerase sigma-70 factor (ECF subfamily)
MAEPLDLDALWARYGPLVLRRCRQILRDEDEALDVTQDVFVALLRRRETLEVRFPSSLIYRMATNLALNRIRDRRRLPESVEEERLADIARLDDDPDGAVHARSLLDKLFARHQPSTRLMAVSHFVDGLTLEEVAREFDMSVSGVRKRLRGLRETLTEMEGA